MTECLEVYTENNLVYLELGGLVNLTLLSNYLLETTEDYIKLLDSLEKIDEFEKKQSSSFEVPGYFLINFDRFRINNRVYSTEIIIMTEDSYSLYTNITQSDFIANIRKYINHLESYMTTGKNNPGE